MKLFLVAFSVLVYSLSSVSSAFTRQTTKVEGFTAISLIGSELSVTYEIGGGCANHEAEFYVSLIKDGTNWIAQVHVLDLADAVDLCEALLTVSGTTDLTSQILRAASKASLKEDELNQIKIQLPSTRLALAVE